ncbi:sigma 54-interacting transcriptional regulator [Butyricicoccus faecihominis]|uniref:sigma-54 interaction domain-containing protein n=1 Tax=Butyricicoccus faecihominis TaxID=1712515 RepID=UPI002478E46E|nr:sigma 54-interacting transcriptional regulator [Butyricicoccus faecihominis]MCQ5128478.1 sigma 54-interacting transcriptional regulator [Butyricicoccus faecihominis]
MMTYRNVMDAFSHCGLGAILTAQDNAILDINETGDRLLHGEGKMKGMVLDQAAPFLLKDEGADCIGNPAFNVYLKACPSPELADLPPGTRLLVFRDATQEVRHDILLSILDHVPEAITVYDSECRMLMLNGAAEKLESHLSENILGKHGEELFTAQKDSVLAIPLVLEEKRPILNLRQNFVTHLGKKLHLVSNSYPIMEKGRLVAAMCMQEDLSALDNLSKRVSELQRLLTVAHNSPKAQTGPSLSASYHFSDISYTGAAMRKTIERCQLIAESDSPVMIYGETGTGKELFAQSIHNASRRRDRPFIAINCAAIPGTLLESMLFGTEKGAYTGALQREGLLEQANMGTLLLDEINSMDITLQSKLLRVLQDGMVRRVGGLNSTHVDVRIISNTNIPPMQAIEEKQLRKDLYYRLGVVNITIPPLRERKDDIPLLAKNFIMAGNEKIRKNASGLDEQTLQIFYAYDWPGNVRELQHAIEYALNILPHDLEIILPEYIPEHILEAVGAQRYAPVPAHREPQNVRQAMQEAARRCIRQALEQNGNNISRTAKAVGLTRQNLQHYIKKLGMIP